MSRIQRRSALLVGVLFALSGALANADQPPSAEQYYAHAIEAMRGVQQPNYATYDVRVHVTGAGFTLTREPNGKASVGFVIGDKRAKPDATFPAAYRRRDDLTSVQTAEGSWGVIHMPLFDPTWNGIDDWIRYGFNGPPDSATAPPSPTPAPDGLPVIAAVRAMGVAFYNVVDGGSAACANGDAGHRLHLIARRDPLDHPLTDAVVDMRTNRLCFARFGMHQSIVAVGYNSTIELNIGDENGESVVQSGMADLTLRAMGFGVKRITMSFAYDHFAFPKVLSGELFPTT